MIVACSQDNEERSTMRAATVYRREGRYFLHALSRTTDGLWMLCDPVLTASEGEGAETLGRKIVAALDGSRIDVPPRTGKGLLAPLLAISGVRSWAAFAKSATCVEIEEEGGRITLVPTRNLGPKGGFEHLTDLAFATLDDPAQLGVLTAEVLRTVDGRRVPS